MPLQGSHRVAAHCTLCDSPSRVRKPELCGSHHHHCGSIFARGLRKNDWHSSANRALLSPPRRDITLAWRSRPAGDTATVGLRW